ncbi:flagella assembly protein FlgT middle domain-containing protein [Methylomarinum sp. Ch1-1]|uniref:Flagella assembly protein FlgT middle domain-containing protein n=1 Tax=Methylomarinum roseum TaxID=3067653 RepID=A0AAU7P027_9GAMM|nr:flagella assembly protein FlgT middle domain-containing protein [Methylomarinum sp. Ch1-1]MDP4520103.1 flagella assembly protein FlgT middle domain-containing protein [Methylomarinum sp. Ch1-1]
MKLLCRALLLAGLLLQGCASTTPGSSAVSGNDDQSKAKVFSAEGQAAIVDSDVFQARRQAIQTAINNVAAQAGHGNVDVLTSNTKVVDEWREGRAYHVQVLAKLSENQACQAPYRKRIVATAFPIVTSGQISGNESQDIYGGIPREINNLLLESGDFIARNKTDISLYSRPDLAPEIMRADDYFGSSIINVARQAEAQFVLSGVIRDFEVESGEYIRGAGVFAQIKSAFREVVARRGITLDVYVHDGFSGALLFQHRYSDSILGDVWIPSGYSVGSERFKSTPAGNKITAIIEMASEDIRRLFSCYPFAARVVKVDNDRIVIAAGSQDKIQRGDNLVVYAADSATHGLGVSGTNKESIGMVKIDSVNAAFAVGRLAPPLTIRKVRVGDWVKSW